MSCLLLLVHVLNKECFMNVAAVVKTFANQLSSFLPLDLIHLMFFFSIFDDFRLVSYLWSSIFRGDKGLHCLCFLRCCGV